MIIVLTTINTLIAMNSLNGDSNTFMTDDILILITLLACVLYWFYLNSLLLISWRLDKNLYNMKIKKITQSQINRMTLLSMKGLSQREIAKKIGCSRSAVYYWLNK